MPPCSRHQVSITMLPLILTISGLRPCVHPLLWLNHKMVPGPTCNCPDPHATALSQYAFLRTPQLVASMLPLTCAQPAATLRNVIQNAGKMQHKPNWLVTAANLNQGSLDSRHTLPTARIQSTLLAAKSMQKCTTTPAALWKPFTAQRK